MYRRIGPKQAHPGRQSGITYYVIAVRASILESEPNRTNCKNLDIQRTVYINQQFVYRRQNLVVIYIPSLLKPISTQNKIHNMEKIYIHFATQDPNDLPLVHQSRTLHP